MRRGQGRAGAATPARRAGRSPRNSRARAIAPPANSTQAAGRGLVVDCRSSTYAAAWTPTGQLASRWVQVHVPGATHMAKHTRGLVAAAICELESEPRTPAALASTLAASGRFEVSLAEPARPGRAWTLSTTPA